VGEKEFSVFKENDLPWQGEFQELKNVVSYLSFFKIIDS
jgi:hypothetical protein